MSVRINLLPHREAKRRAARRHFYVLALLTAVLGVVIVVAVHGFYAGQIAQQDERNEFMKKEIAKLDKEIEEIKRLRDEIQSLLARKQVIETLQADRAQTVYLLDQLVRQMPEGVYVTKVVQKGQRVTLTGYAQSNARVSTLMRNIEGSPWLTRPELLEIKAATVDRKRVSEFNMALHLRRVQPEAPKDAAKPAAKPAADAKKG